MLLDGPGKLREKAPAGRSQLLQVLKDQNILAQKIGHTELDRAACISLLMMMKYLVLSVNKAASLKESQEILS